MNTKIRNVINFIYIVIILIATIIIIQFSKDYYLLSDENRYFLPSGMVNPIHNLLKPSGMVGHGLGIVGSLSIIIGIFSYMARKRVKLLSNFFKLKYWLDFHIFTCTLGVILILFHTTFKFIGISSLAFYSLVAVWISGVIGRFLYLRVPHSIDGRELTLSEINDLKEDIKNKIKSYNIEIETLESYTFKKIKKLRRDGNILKNDYKKIKKLLLKELLISKQIDHLRLFHRLFRFWHIVHFPFALIFLILMFFHIANVIFWGYTWIF